MMLQAFMESLPSYDTLLKRASAEIMFKDMHREPNRMAAIAVPRYVREKAWLDLVGRWVGWGGVWRGQAWVLGS